MIVNKYHPSIPMYQLEVHCFTFELKKHLDQSDAYAKILKMKVERGGSKTMEEGTWTG